MGFSDSTRKRKRCEHAGCTTRPNFNLEGEKRGRFCAEHKSPGMVNVKDKRCEHAGWCGMPGISLEARRHALPNARRPIKKRRFVSVKRR